MVWDGECEFCRLCADRFKSAGVDTVEFIPFQDLHSKYPKAPQLDYKNSVVLFSQNSFQTGAAAVYSYYAEIGIQWPLRLYKRLNLFSSISESSYLFIANNRKFFLIFIAVGMNNFDVFFNMSASVANTIYAHVTKGDIVPAHWVSAPAVLFYQ